MRLGIVGGGAMGEALTAAVLKAGLAEPANICISDIVPNRLHYLKQKYGVAITAGNADAAKGADYVFLMVKPQDFDKAGGSLARSLDNATVASILPGVTIGQLRGLLGSERIVRFMSNTPAQIGEGMTAWTATDAVSDAQRAGLREIFAALGREAYVADERYLDMVTALSGSGPAYVFLFIEALTDAGVHIGLSRDLAATLALQTVLGSARYAAESQRHPAELRNQVTSPGGTTAEALRAFEAAGFRSAVLEGVIKAYDKSRSLGEAGKK
jgi:pyrroline-5-carboxylate reductase